MTSCWKPPTSSPTAIPWASRCKLHHAAFDRHLIGVTPDFEVTVRLDVLEEIDGPMLQHRVEDCIPGCTLTRQILAA
jgi:putative restriction endonuclease